MARKICPRGSRGRKGPSGMLRGAQGRGWGALGGIDCCLRETHARIHGFWVPVHLLGQRQPGKSEYPFDLRFSLPSYSQKYGFRHPLVLKTLAVHFHQTIGSEGLEDLIDEPEERRPKGALILAILAVIPFRCM